MEELLDGQDFRDMERPVTGLDLISLLSGGRPRAGIYRSEVERIDGSVLVETRVVDRHGRTHKHEVTPKPPATGKRKQNGKSRS